jgi:LysM repeat protein
MAEDRTRPTRANLSGQQERIERARRARVPSDAATYLALLLLLTPLLGAVRLLVGREPAASAETMTQVVEVPRLVYIEVPAPTVAPTVASLEPTAGPPAEPVVLVPEVLPVLESPEPEQEPVLTVVVQAPASLPRETTAPAARVKPAVAAAAGTGTGTGTGSVVRYVVAPGDTLFSLARRHGTSVETIRGLNGMRPESTLRAGQQLRIPNLAGPVHVVEPGQTLYGIARSYDVDPRVLASTNGLSSNLMVQAGQRLVVPKEMADPTAVPAEEPTATPLPSATATATPKPKKPTPTPTRTPTPRRR